MQVLIYLGLPEFDSDRKGCLSLSSAPTRLLSCIQKSSGRVAKELRGPCSVGTLNSVLA